MVPVTTPAAPVVDAARTDTSGLRERKKAARRLALVDATHRLVAEHGLDAVTVEMICAEVGVSPRTFFNYFDTKDDAVLGHGPWSLDERAVLTFVEGGPTGVLLDDVRELVAVLVAAAPVGRDRLHRALELVAVHPRLMAHHLAWMDRQKAQLSELVHARLGDDPPVAADTVTGLVVFCAHTALVRWEDAGGTGEIRPHLDAVVADLRTLVAT